MTILKNSYDKSKGSAFVLFKVVSGKPSAVETIYLEGMRVTEISPHILEPRLSKYLSTKDIDQVVVQPPAPQPKTVVAAPRKISASGYSDPRDIRDEQEYNYQRMIDEENRKADEARRKLEEKQFEELTLQKKMLSIQRRERLKKETYIANLPAEPSSGDIIKIAVRLPDGARLQRTFNRSDLVEVVFS